MSQLSYERYEANRRECSDLVAKFIESFPDDLDGKAKAFGTIQAYLGLAISDAIAANYVKERMAEKIKLDADIASRFIEEALK
jgi:hypothetical protein